MGNLISVIVPVYNAALYLRECIGSVISQTYKNWELMLVDDGSTDGSGDICDEMARIDRRIVVLHQENSGVTAARAKGVSAARGEYIYFLDSDDTIAPDTLDYMFSRFDDGADMVVTNCNEECVLDKGQYVEYLFSHRLWYLCMKLYRRRLFDETSLDVPRYFRSGEDFLTNLRLLKNMSGGVKCFTAQKYFYRQVTTSATHTFVPTMEYELRMLQEVADIVKFLPKIGTLDKAYFGFRLEWFGGMIGLRYPLDVDADWVKELEAESSRYKLNFKQRIMLGAVKSSFCRALLMAEKDLKRYRRKLLSLFR